MTTPLTDPGDRNTSGGTVDATASARAARHPLAEKPAPTGLAQAREQFRTLLAADYPKNPFPIQRITLAVWRANQVLKDQPGIGAFVLRRIVRVVDTVWVRGIVGAELPPQVWAGPGLRISHGARGVILHPTVRIGSDATIYHQVTIGVKDAVHGAATLGDGVYIGAGAKILGEIHLADGTSVGANAVLTKSTEPGKTYVGVPARAITPRSGSNAS